MSWQCNKCDQANYACYKAGTCVADKFPMSDSVDVSWEHTDDCTKEMCYCMGVSGPPCNICDLPFFMCFCDLSKTND